jgi:tRNA nucleotidyltransferase (CCA-adding enzyme)
LLSVASITHFSYNVNMKIKVPDEVIQVSKTLAEAGFEAYLVGGCVRDMLLGREPKDWDITTDAKPEEIQKLFPDSVYENDFGTVGIKTESEDPRLKIIEVTTYRIEGKYTDQRHPDEIKFASNIEDDLARRDFTVNALAMNLKGDVIDPYDGRDDLKAKIIRTVGKAEERFSEDALRMMRAVRFAVELDFEIELNTRRAIEKLAGGLESIAKERVRDELVKIIMTPNATKGIILLEELDLLRYVLPELREGLGVGQNKHHIYTVFEHNVRALDYTAGENYSLVVRMASLLHDVGKPKVKAGDGPDSTFYNHEYVGAKLAARALDRLRFSKDFIQQVTHLIRSHMFYYNVGEISPAGIRRFLVRVGPENIDDLLKVREADRIGSGVKKAVPYKLRHLLFMIEKVKKDPLSPKMLKVNGDDMMKELNMAPGRRVGWILNALLEEVLEDPEKNERGQLIERMKELDKLDDLALEARMESARNKKSELEGEIEDEIKKKHHVQ